MEQVSLKWSHTHFKTTTYECRTKKGKTFIPNVSCAIPKKGQKAKKGIGKKNEYLTKPIQHHKISLEKRK